MWIVPCRCSPPRALNLGWQGITGEEVDSWGSLRIPFGKIGVQLREDSGNHHLGPWTESYYNQLSHEKKPGWMGYIGDEILPSYIGIIS